jgi:hypothetical protein
MNKILLLKEQEMVGMVNFVASETNIAFLQSKHNMTLDDLVELFDKIGVFVNVASDINIFKSKNFLKKRKFKKLLAKYTCREDWRYLRESMSPGYCEAGKHFFTVDKNGAISTCLDQKAVGNFFEGTLQTCDKIMCAMPCQSIVAYPFRMDNDFPYRNNLSAYVERNRAHRKRAVK